MDEFPDKQPYEEFYIGFNFFRRLLAGQTIATITSVTVVDDATPPVDVTDTLTRVELLEIDGKQVNVWVRAGSSGHTYKLTCKIVTSGGQKHELEGTLAVVEI